MTHASRRPLIAGNWKMHGSSADVRTWTLGAVALARETEREVAIFPPTAWLGLSSSILSDTAESTGGHDGGPVSLGAQACHTATHGAFTGATAASMASELGCAYVLCGHSERRHVFGETDAFVAASLRAAIDAGLTPVLCVGETEDEREAGQTEEVLARQLDAGLDALPGPDAPLVVAYEPVWAIGTGKAATPVEAAEAHAFLRARVAKRDAARAQTLRILYGGSVKPANAAGFFAVEDIDGALIGGAALDPESFKAIGLA